MESQQSGLINTVSDYALIVPSNLAEIDLVRSRNRWQTVDPYVLDMSCREPATTSPFGQTTNGKFEIFRTIKDLGFEHVAVAAFYHGREYTIEEAFVERIIESRDYNLHGCFAMYQPGDDEAWAKIEGYGIPNVFIEAAIKPDNIRVGNPHADRVTVILNELTRVREHFSKPKFRGDGLIYLNIVDLVDIHKDVTKIFSDPLMLELIPALQKFGIDGFCYEEFRGLWDHKQYGYVAKKLRPLFPSAKILVHAHAGFGLADASALEAVANGADGIWSGFTHAAQAGHNSSIVYLAKLHSLGNPNVKKKFRVDDFIGAAQKIHTMEVSGK